MPQFLDSNRYKVLVEIYQYIQKYNRSPSYDELSSSKGNAYWHVGSLIKEEFIEKEMSTSRSLILTSKGEELAKLLIEYAERIPHG